MQDRISITDANEFYCDAEDIYAYWPNSLRPQVFFNQRVFCSKDYLKARVFLSSAVSQKPELTISIDKGNGDGPGLEVISTEMEMSHEWYGPRPYTEQCFKSLPIKELEPGEYVVRVSLGDSEIGPETETISSGGEHRFFVLADDHYQDYWRSLYGGDWDAPIYFDNITEIQVGDLLNGLPLDSLWTRLSDPIQLNAETLYKLIGPIAATFIGNDVPFIGYWIRYEPWTSELPRVDLTKLIWALHALSPVLANWAFLSNRISIGVTCNAEGLSFRFATSPIEILHGSAHSDDERIYQLPRLTEIVSESIEDFIKIEVSKESIL